MVHSLSSPARSLFLPSAKNTFMGRIRSSANSSGSSRMVGTRCGALEATAIASTGVRLALLRRLFCWLIWTAFTLAYLLRILYAPNPSADASVALHTIQANIPIMERVGFQADLVSHLGEQQRSRGQVPGC